MRGPWRAWGTAERGRRIEVRVGNLCACRTIRVGAGIRV